MASRYSVYQFIGEKQWLRSALFTCSIKELAKELVSPEYTVITL